ncbi:MAG: 30S ribosomal protein S3 [Candidatus Aenigmarchaeota archaeon]|nr:30S ribosomal protein S3 [Candidatus Aenigmarchaeota archaeon]
MKERIFIQKAKEQVSLEEFIRSQFRQAKVGDIEIQHTPVVTRIILYTTTPGLIIGSGGERIKEMSETIRREYKIENPQIDVQKIDDADLDPHIVAQSIANQIESGVNYKRLGNYYLERIMQAGATGCEIVITGKLSGERSRRERFYAGYLKKCGEPALREVMKGFALANPKLGNIGITVKIMMTQPEKLLSVARTTAQEEPKKVMAKVEEPAKPVENETAASG